MKVKCFAIYEEGKELLSEFVSPSQQQFLDFELKSVMKSYRPSSRIQFQNTANGVWYIRQCPCNALLHQIILLSKESSSMGMAANFLNKVTQLQQTYQPHKNKQKLKMKISEMIKISNANKKLDSLNSNVMQLQEMMKGNVNKMVNNMTQLESAQKKSQAMVQLSVRFERDAKSLQDKLKRRKCMMKLLIGGIISIIIGIVIYVLFM